MFEALFLIYSYIITDRASLFSNGVHWIVQVFFIFLYVSAAVNWHRMLLLDKPLAEVKLLPERREVRYLVRLFIANIYTVGIVSIVLIVIFLLLLNGNLPETEETDIFFNSVIEWGVLILLSVSIYIMATAFMSLPASSIDATSFKWPQKVAERFAWRKETRKTIALVFFYSSLPNMVLSIILVLTSQIPFLGSFLSISGNFLFTIADLYWMLAFATVLSLLYKEHVLPDLVEEAQKQNQALQREEK